MISEIRQQIKRNEKTVNRWKEERLCRILNQSVILPDNAADVFYEIINEFPNGFAIETLRERIDAQMPDLWKLMPPPKNETQWEEYFNDLLTDCAVDGCMTVKEVWQIIGYDAIEFEEMRGNGFSFVQAFDELLMQETDEQMNERTKDLSLEECKERIEHYVRQTREAMTEVARLNNECFKKFGINIPLDYKKDLFDNFNQKQ